MVVFVTGATGFVGKKFLEVLRAKRDIKVVALSRKNQEVENADISVRADIFDFPTTKAVIRDIKPDVMVHLAWSVGFEGYMQSELNVRWIHASFHLAKVFFEFGGKKIVVAGTCAEYDWARKVLKEDRTPLTPHTIYGASKVALYLLLKNLCFQLGRKMIWARLFFVFGPGELETRFIPQIILNLTESGQAVCLKSRVKRDFIFVEDVADALAKFLSWDYTGAVNVGTGRALSLRAVSEKIRKICSKYGFDGKVVFKNEPDPFPYIRADISLLRKVKENFFNIDTALERTVLWWIMRKKNTKY